MTAEASHRVIVRPLELGDLGQLLLLEDAHGAAIGGAAVVGRASVHFYQRSGHSFVAERGAPAGADPPSPLGFVLAHSSWSGAGAVVRLERLVVASPSDEVDATTAAALTAAVVKSAYDAGVYRLVANPAGTDRLTRAALEATGFSVLPDVSYQRLLGAGALSGSGADSSGAEPGAHDRSGRGGEHDGS